MSADTYLQSLVILTVSLRNALRFNPSYRVTVGDGYNGSRILNTLLHVRLCLSFQAKDSISRGQAAFITKKNSE
jgi:hypothetical protein